MNAARRGFLLVLTIAALAIVAEAKDWRGLIPLHSTREDVVQLMGEWQWAPAGRTTTYQPLTDSDPYYLPEGEIYFSYAPRVDERRDSLPREIAPGLLLTIRFTPITPWEWSQLLPNRSAFRRLDPTSGESAFERYADDADGLIVRTNGGRIVELIYLPRGEDREPFAKYFDALQSGDLSANAIGGPIVEDESEAPIEDGGDEVVAADNDDAEAHIYPGPCVIIVGSSDFDPKRMLDRASIELSEDPTARGYITIYPDLRERPNEFELESNRVLSYLADVKGIDRSRISILYGGQSFGTWFEYQLVPLGQCRPCHTKIRQIRCDD